ncbi:MAG: glycosyltransferase, partial [Thermodesulfobacteriota bacterium]|nr:glycosyltransferase [Thermodesulfobacteriota bacterium]
MKPMVIIPTYNERKNIPILVAEILSLDGGFHITIVDDNSPDGTGEVADQLEVKYRQVHVIHRAHKMG